MQPTNYPRSITLNTFQVADPCVFSFPLGENSSYKALIKVSKALRDTGCAKNPYESTEIMSQLSYWI